MKRGGIEDTEWWGHWSVKYSTGNTVNNIARTTYDARSALLTGGSLHKLCNCLTTVLYTQNGYKIVLTFKYN